MSVNNATHIICMIQFYDENEEGNAEILEPLQFYKMAHWPTLKHALSLKTQFEGKPIDVGYTVTLYNSPKSLLGHLTLKYCNNLLSIVTASLLTLTLLTL